MLLVTAQVLIFTCWPLGQMGIVFFYIPTHVFAQYMINDPKFAEISPTLVRDQVIALDKANEAILIKFT